MTSCGVRVVQGFWEVTLFQPGTLCVPKTAYCCISYTISLLSCIYTSHIGTYAS